MSLHTFLGVTVITSLYTKLYFLKNSVQLNSIVNQWEYVQFKDSVFVR